MKGQKEPWTAGISLGLFGAFTILLAQTVADQREEIRTLKAELAALQATCAE